jgi:hypothetical protein
MDLGQIDAEDACSADLTSNDGVLTCFVFTRGLESLPTDLAPLSVSAAIKDSNLRSQSNILTWYVS